MANADRLPGLTPMHPGELLREEILPALGIDNAELARNLGAREATIAEILAERAPVTVDMALRLAKLCGNSATFWLNLQRDHDLGRLEPAMASELAAIPTLRDADDHGG
jgi:addiction module HigA family antidote